jgi:periplasmic divalent cation tolerance protein
MNHLIVMTTMPDMASAEQLADNLIENSLAACVNILPAMQSIYRWQGKRQQGTEHQLMIKTCADRYKEIEKFIKKHHPYELPEIIGLPIQHGLTDYLSWITENCEKN